MTSPRSAGWRGLTIAVLLMACLLLGGCQGCRRWNPFAGRSKKPKKKRPVVRPYSFRPLGVYPSDKLTAGLKPVKPGHITEFTWGARANLADVRGELQLSVVDRNSGTPLLVPGTRFQLTYSRSVVLPKGQEKRFRLLYPLPVSEPRKVAKFAMRHRLIPRQSKRSLNLTRDPVTPIPGYQYFLLVLAAEPDRYAFVKQLHAIRQPPFDLAASEPEVYYQVVMSDAERPAPLPEHPFAWSPIAYILWDDLAPQRLTENQARSLVDWLHWGGQLIISGPGSLDSLKGSFLDPYLPVQTGGNRQLNQTHFDAINKTWQFHTDGKHGRPHVEILEDRPLGGVVLQLREGGSFVPGTGEMVAERRVGRGRIAVTAFPLEARPLINWVGYDSFFHSCVLRKPARVFEIVDEIQPVWRYCFVAGRKPSALTDIALGTSLRYFARDTGKSAVLDAKNPLDEFTSVAAAGRKTGMAAWNDHSAVSEAAEKALQEASGITIPSRDFVWKNLAIYLVILVPVNWGLFRLMGRVEWAWAATPLIAVIGAVWIVREAQLNIGFARSRSEVAVLELQPRYGRGHLSRYLALYSSLSTSFDLEFDSPTAMVLPFGGGGKPGVQTTRVASLQIDRKTRLGGFFVDSNSTAMLHSEEMMDVGGPIELNSDESIPTLVNRSRLALTGVGVIRRTSEGEIEAAWVGDLKPRARVSLQFRPASPARPWFPQWDRLSVSSSDGGDSSGTPSVRRLLEIAVRNLVLRRGEARLVGWTGNGLAGVRIAPAISQAHGVTFVLQHLRFARYEAPQRDRNLIEEVTNHADTSDTDVSIPGGN